MSGLVLSLFPGVGLLDLAFEEAGFCIVRGPDLLWGGDVRRFHPPAGRFDGVVGGPPCQHWSRLRHIVENNGHARAPDLIPEFVRCVVEARPAWFVMEMVPEAPDLVVPGFDVRRRKLRDCWFGGATRRLRQWSFGGAAARAPEQLEFVALHDEPQQSALASGAGRPVPVALGKGGRRKRSRTAALSNVGYKTVAAFEIVRRQQGLPDSFDLPPFTVKDKIAAVGNGVPLAMGRAVARAVRRSLEVERC